VQRSGHRFGPPGLLIAATAMVIAACGTATQELPDHAKSAPVPARPPIAAQTSRVNGPSTSWEDRERQADAILAWYQTVRDDPDPMVRLQVIERWTQQQAPDDRLDLLTHTLVDPDESVRARAQELLEERLARR
jgi:hypothetical protein